jgi:hypothetical protein
LLVSRAREDISEGTNDIFMSQRSKSSEYMMKFNIYFICGILRTHPLEAGYNTSTVAPRIIEGDEEGTWALGV